MSRAAFQDTPVVSPRLNTLVSATDSSANLPVVRATEVAVRPSASPVPTALPSADIERVLAGRNNVESDIVKSMLEDAKASDADEVGARLNEVVALLKGLDPASLKKDGLLSKFLHFGATAKERFHAEFDSTKTRVNTVVVELDKHIALHVKRKPEFERMYEANRDLCLAYENEDKPLIQRQVAVLKAQAEAMGESREIFAAQDRKRILDEVDRLEQFLHNLELKIKRCHQRAPFLENRMTAAQGLIDAGKHVKTDLIPIWEETIADTLYAKEQEKSARAISSVYDATDEAMRKQAEAGRAAIEATATVRQRDVIKVDTLEFCNRQLIEGFEAVRRIDAEARQRRINELPRLEAIDRELLALANNASTQP